MFDLFDDFDWKHVITFAGGVLCGTAGIRLLSTEDAKRVYVKSTAAVLRAKDCIMDQVTMIQENAEDIYEEAKQLNEDRLAAEVYIDDIDEDSIEIHTEK